MKPVTFHPDAEVELDDATQRYEGAVVGLGLDFQDEAARVLEMAQRLPDLGSPYARTNARILRLRRFPYLVYYVNREHDIFVCAIAHNSRRPGYWTNRLP